MGLLFGDSRAAEPRVSHVQAAPAVPLQLVSMPRVKVFRLNNGGGWDDCGTGHATIDYLEGPRSRRGIVLAVIGEENDDTILLHLITPDDIYRKQQETIITWCDLEAGMTLSLSFQDGTGCSSIWNEICQVQRKQRPGLQSASDTNAPQG
ncbi:unnamed protein product [Alopecurus aequalis]